MKKGRVLPWIGWFVHWGWVVLLGVLLVGCVVFSAPGKLIGLLGVLFGVGVAAGLKRWRRWYWAGISLVVLVLIVWVLLPTDSEGWRPFVFEQEMEQFLARYRLPDEDNAALVYEELRRQWEADDANWPQGWPEVTKKGPWRSQEHPEISAWMDSHEGTIARLTDASRMKGCFFEDEVRLELRSGYLQPVAIYRQWARLLVCAANRDLGQGQSEAALENQLATLRMAGHLCEQPVGIDILVGRAIEALALEHIRRTVVEGEIDATYLAMVDKAVARPGVDWQQVLPEIVECDKLMVKNMSAGMTYQVNDAGQVRLSRKPWAFLHEIVELIENEDIEEAKLWRTAYRGYVAGRLAKMHLIVKWFVFPSRPEEMAQIIDRSYEKYGRMLKQGYEPKTETGTVFTVIEDSNWWLFEFNFEYMMDRMAAMAEESYRGLDSVFGRAQTDRRGTRVILALRRYRDAHGRWPEDLDSAREYGDEAVYADGWGRPFVYESRDDGFILYSTGQNGIDEGGEHEEEYSEDYRTRTTISDDWMIWPTGRKKSREQSE